MMNETLVMIGLCVMLASLLIRFLVIRDLRGRMRILQKQNSEYLERFDALERNLLKYFNSTHVKCSPLLSESRQIVKEVSKLVSNADELSNSILIHRTARAGIIIERLEREIIGLQVNNSHHPNWPRKLDENLKLLGAELLRTSERHNMIMRRATRETLETLSDIGFDLDELRNNWREE